MITTMPKIEAKLDKEIASFFQNRRFREYPIKRNKHITYKNFLEDKMLIIVAIRSGIPYSLFNLIQDTTPFSEKDWANFLDISTKSLKRYRATSDYRFKSVHSEKIIQMAEVAKEKYATMCLPAPFNIDEPFQATSSL